MEPLEFIEVNVKSSLEREGFSGYVSSNCDREAVRHYKRQASFSKGKVFDECLKRARNQAKMMKRSGE